MCGILDDENTGKLVVMEAIHNCMEFIAIVIELSAGTVACIIALMPSGSIQIANMCYCLAGRQLAVPIVIVDAC